MRGRLLTVLLVCAFLVGCGGSVKPFPIIGTWRGTLHQHGLKPFAVRATVHALASPARNLVHYGGIDCHGRWTYLGRAKSAFRFREVITGGRSKTCKGSGTVTLTPAGKRVRYEFRGGGIVSRGLLSRAPRP